MIESEILREKHRIQAELSNDSASIHEYLFRSHVAAIEIAESFGFCLQYADLPRKKGQAQLNSHPPARLIEPGPLSSLSNGSLS